MAVSKWLVMVFLEHVDRKETEEHVFVRATGCFFVCFRLILLFRRYVIDSVSWEGSVPFRYSWSTYEHT